MPVMAISPNPFLVMAKSALISPKQLPQDKIVKASSALGKWVIKPNSLSRSMMHLLVKLIHAIDITKLSKE